MFRKYMLTAKSKAIFCLFIFLSFQGLAQTNLYFVTFTDKSASDYSLNAPEEFLSPKAIARRKAQGIQIQEEDLPVNKNYLDSLNKLGITIKGSSRWLNGVIAETSQEVSEEISKKQFVKSVEYLQPAEEVSNPLRLSSVSSSVHQQSSSSSIDYGPSLTQNAMIGVPAIHAAGYSGAGKLIAVLDNGFLNANTLTFFNHLFQGEKIIGTYDFVSGEENVYDDGNHGVNVLSVLAGFEEGKIVGPAYNASFLLLRTENDFSETILEEYNWLLAAEYADSAGADIISSSLGYNTFDFPAQDHTYADMDGKSTVVTKAAETAFAKGMIVVNSAGNEGNKSWKYVSAPADGPSVLTIGAVNSTKNYASFSSVGPSADGRIKPDLTAMGAGVYAGNPDNSFSTTNGTSFSCPLVAGLVACLWQARPDLSNKEITDALKKTASKAENPDFQYGFGIPNFEKAIAFSSADTVIAGLFPNPVSIPGEVKLIIENDLVSNDVQAELFDLTGKKIFAKTLSKAEKINQITFPGDIQRGVYILVLNSISANQVIRIILQ
ncbi:MAG: S8 family serine peptidase [Sporocytophaga sp.]|uniref:S8 family serine peptidase n=1 Tax=Sporocytophaga sp. TaxID=2231183 RepID=UPI001B1B14BD|nr:S8 family serine peptidase [Sporocytophaga sp.]MBO9700654.1 S8 family serine peptidase [Sporocytophaga sp.]